MKPVATEMTGGEALVAQLVREGVRHVFAVPGQQLDHATDAFAKASDRIAFVTNRHEQGSAYMADGYARASGEVGVCMVVPGPGLLNAMAGLATAYACSSPVLCIVGQVPSALIGRGVGVLHEVPHQSRLLESVTKWHAMASRPQEIPALVREAFARMHSGRPRPVAIEIPPDVLAGTADVDPIDPLPGSDRAPAPEPRLLEEAARLLAEARRPVIYAGWGVQASDATAELRALCEILQAPVVMTRAGLGALPARHPLALTRLSGRAVLPDADVVLVVGSRFMGLGGKAVAVAPGARLIMIDIDEGSFAAPRAPDLAIVADAKPALSGLARLLDSAGGARGANRSRGAELAEGARRWAAGELAAIEPQMSFLNALRSVMPDDGVLATDLTQVAYLVRIGFPFQMPRSNLTSGYQGTLGSGFPMALGAKVAQPDRAVVALTGDGGFCWNLQELATARQYDIGVVTVVFNDQAYGNVRRAQMNAFAGRSIGTALKNPDFISLAASFGIAACRAETPAELAAAVAGGIESGEPMVIEVPTGDMPSPWHLL